MTLREEDNEQREKEEEKRKGKKNSAKRAERGKLGEIETSRRVQTGGRNTNKLRIYWADLGSGHVVDAADAQVSVCAPLFLT